MKTYLVGGAVRDLLLDLKRKDRDWVVVGATPAAMLQQGYRQVGKSFPVFLHPVTGEEHALARKEKKVAAGYTGFQCDFHSTVTLEADLARRDLTINAIAQSADGNFIDPFGGMKDIKQRILRHVSAAFVEDPLRILRVARFFAQLAPFNFTIAISTHDLLQQMVAAGELLALTTERVWLETIKALTTASPVDYFWVLTQCGALKRLFPSLISPIEHDANVPCNEKKFYRAFNALTFAAKTDMSLKLRFVALCCQIYRATLLTVTAQDHCMLKKREVITLERAALQAVNDFCQRWKIEKSWQDIALLMARNFTKLSQLTQLSATELFRLFEQFDVWRRPTRLDEIIAIKQLCEMSLYGETVPSANFYAAYRIMRTVSVDKIRSEGFCGKAISEELARRRLQLWSQYNS